LTAQHDTARDQCLDEGDALTLDKAIQIGQNQEAAQESMRNIAVSSGEDSKGQAIYNPKNYKRTKARTHVPAKETNKDIGTSKDKMCGYCGYNPRDPRHKTCPSRRSICSYYAGKDHFEKVCRKKARDAATAHNVHCDSDDESTGIWKKICTATTLAQSKMTMLHIYQITASGGVKSLLRENLLPLNFTLGYKVNNAP
jgi:hypothetical protein